MMDGPLLPPGWVEASDPRYGGAPFWFHRETRETSWTRPTGHGPPPPKDVWGIGMPLDLLQKAYSYDRSPAALASAVE
jgi:hypothetical protein